MLSNPITVLYTLLLSWYFQIKYWAWIPMQEKKYLASKDFPQRWDNSNGCECIYFYLYSILKNLMQTKMCIKTVKRIPRLLFHSSVVWKFEKKNTQEIQCFVKSHSWRNPSKNPYAHSKNTLKTRIPQQNPWTNHWI